MPNTAHRSTDSRARRRDDFRPYTAGPPPVRLSDLEAERDALRDMVKKARARERLLFL
jgi:hypothetical protein